jgi:hypothetical protein
MSSDMHPPTPEQAQGQKIFDLIWMELRQNGGVNFFGPLEPDVLREEIARRVAHHSNGGNSHPDDVTQSVLNSFGIGAKINWRV